MKVDFLSYQRAAQVAIIGLLIQIALGVGLLIYARLGNDFSAQVAAWTILVGALGWLCLSVVFDQHRRERLEALEAEQLDASARTSAFEGAAEDLKIQARRLAFMHRLLVPAVSLTMAALLGLICFMFIRAGFAQTQLEAGGIDPFAAVKPTSRGWAVTMGLGLAVIGFIVGRYVAGMAKQKVWANLRGGAAYMALTSIFGLSMALGHFIDMAGSDLVLRYLQVAIPGFAAYLAVEILLSSLLNLYRPRKAGDVPRAAFDSPVLGFVASPDQIARTLGGAISYQLGVDISSSWAYQLVSRAVLPLVLFAAGVLWIMSAFTVVDTTERAFLLRNGSNIRELEPGWHFKWPWPIDRIERTNVTGIRGMDLATPGATKETRALLWTNDHGVREEFVILQSAAVRTAAGTDVRDMALMAVEVPLRFRIRDLAAWENLGVPQARETIVRNIAQRELMVFLARFSEDDVLGARRPRISDELRVRIDRILRGQDPETGAKNPDARDTGVEVISAGIQGVHPPKDTAESFEKIVSNEQKREELVQRATGEAITTLTRSVGSLDLARQIEAARGRASAEGRPDCLADRKRRRAGRRDTGQGPRRTMAASYGRAWAGPCLRRTAGRVSRQPNALQGQPVLPGHAGGTAGCSRVHHRRRRRQPLGESGPEGHHQRREHSGAPSELIAPTHPLPLQRRTFHDRLEYTVRGKARGGRQTKGTRPCRKSSSTSSRW
jgi:membrane protease subunit HflK